MSVHPADGTHIKDLILRERQCMIPLVIYELLPSIYLMLGVFLLSFAQLPLLIFSACLFYLAGAAIWIMRSASRRTDMMQVPDKKWIVPDVLYESMPFFQLFTGTVLIRSFVLAVALPGIFLFFLAIKHLLERHAHRKCASPALA
jgi:predicted tellurium resistance membrane protein TerC